MKLYNTLTRSVDKFTPLGYTVSFYTCGPTVYNYQQIGNYTAFIRSDMLARTLRTAGFNIEWYMNITDVGHLVSDADEGEDKLEVGAKREGKTAWEVAQYYTDDFLGNLDKLNISIDREHLVKATDHIAEQIALIERLEAKGYTYIIEDGVYFDSTKFRDYGKMARIDAAGLQAGARVQLGDKKHTTDFALWKFSPKGVQRDMEWDSPWGKGFPGWHIECSTMAMKYLGDTIDIHAGGIDHIPVHHTNEIAQSEAATGKPFVRFWFHSNFLQVDGVKLSKSLGNSYIIPDLEARGFTAMDFRMFVLQSHYRSEANFTWESLQAAHKRLADLQAIADRRYQLKPEGKDITEWLLQTQQTVETALQDDVNTPLALSALSNLVTQIENESEAIAANESFNSFFEWLDACLGFRLSQSSDLTDDQKALVQQRNNARHEKDWKQSDTIRNRLIQDNIQLNDTPNGTYWFRS